MLAHRASHQGKVAIESLPGEPAVFAPRAIPAVVFTDPEIAWAGLTEHEAAAAGRPPRRRGIVFADAAGGELQQVDGRWCYVFWGGDGDVLRRPVDVDAKLGVSMANLTSFTMKTPAQKTHPHTQVSYSHRCHFSENEGTAIKAAGADSLVGLSFSKCVPIALVDCACPNPSVDLLTYPPHPPTHVSTGSSTTPQRRASSRRPTAAVASPPPPSSTTPSPRLTAP